MWTRRKSSSSRCFDLHPVTACEARAPDVAIVDPNGIRKKLQNAGKRMLPAALRGREVRTTSFQSGRMLQRCGSNVTASSENSFDRTTCRSDYDDESTAVARLEQDEYEICPGTVVCLLNDVESARSSTVAVGSPFPKRPIACSLSAHAWKAVEDLFRMMDADGSNAVTREEARTFFNGTFSKLSADALFDACDIDRSGAITADEFVGYWLQVRAAGYPEKDIIHEVDELMAGAAWVCWMDGPSSAHRRPFPKRPFLCKLSAHAWRKCEELFHKMDPCDSHVITLAQAEEFFRGSFSSMSAAEMFNQLDVKNHGTVTPEEFMAFWVRVRSSGYKEQELIDELDILMSGAAWVDWNEVKTKEHRAPFPKRPLLCKLSQRTWEKCEELFERIDIDGSGLISHKEAANFFTSAFSKFSVEAMFESVAVNNKEVISSEDFMHFWVQVKASGYSESDIIEEVEALINGDPWVDWNVARTDMQSETHSLCSHQSSGRSSSKVLKAALTSRGLSHVTRSKCLTLFERMLDDKQAWVLTPEAAMKFFQGAFAKHSTDEMFRKVDVNNTGLITEEDFINFWEKVKTHGYPERDILNEVDELLSGAAWMDFHLENRFAVSPIRKMSEVAWRTCKGIFDITAASSTDSRLDGAPRSSSLSRESTNSGRRKDRTMIDAS
eukprot:TRINITY_DN16785_c0_g1_i1.p1 TRINITY_DN16785_c0_g1~~TRINITY_DN16785_c0_g1_i1.p1  ORF type:complete len:667 (-),score=136.95 TRINITY_DN16785_c0_g1_i1:73-2073(-)